MALTLVAVIPFFFVCRTGHEDLVDLGERFIGYESACFALHLYIVCSIGDSQHHHRLAHARSCVFFSLASRGPIHIRYDHSITSDLRPLHDALCDAHVSMVIFCCDRFPTVGTFPRIFFLIGRKQRHVVHLSASCQCDPETFCFFVS